MKTWSLVEYIRSHSLDWRKEETMDRLLEAIGDARFVLLGEASHGTSEFYSIRARITQRLLERHGFSFVAVEGDWPSCYALNQYIKSYPGAPESPAEAMKAFGRWPEWMWANREIARLLDWMKELNRSREQGRQAGFYGLDVYSLWESMDAVMEYLTDKGLMDELEKARQAFSCFEPYSRDEQTYGAAAAFLSEDCEKEVQALLQDMRGRNKAAQGDSEEALGAEMNAMAAANAEHYYREMMRGGPESWNVRDRHMVEALERLMDFHGSVAKAIVWEHNTHIGDARATDMKEDGMVNVGQLLREKHPGEVFALGFGTYRGTVIAGRSWGAPLSRMKVPEAAAGSWEELMHQAGSHDQLLLLDNAPEELYRRVGHRAIGVVYHPEYERGNYVPTVVPERYDAFLHVDETRALEPLVLQEV
ncbi:erythromycin esterase family protein [Paenibacillus aurantius]|uniref:Erythromycin esterase family protein n=1 Tax=Paenibacillus aurantius TaxID=2918900 RepID=A0AA96LIC9_9BACL|nr:erythromycin esterase family protein [Paenibacillus aurantius]WNQ13883.1 erythromycin esterase family protein [Paenibacillus aurantius]